MLKVEKVSMYRTSNGKLYTNEKEALAAQEDVICELLSKLIPVGGNLCQSDQYKIISQIMQDHTKTRSILEKIMSAYDFGDDFYDT